MTSDEEKAYEDRLDGSDWTVPPKPDAMVIAELRAEVERLRAALEEIEDGACYTKAYATNCDGRCKLVARNALAIGGAS